MRRLPVCMLPTTCMLGLRQVAEGLKSVLHLCLQALKRSRHPTQQAAHRRMALARRLTLRIQITLGLKSNRHIKIRKKVRTKISQNFILLSSCSRFVPRAVSSASSAFLIPIQRRALCFNGAQTHFICLSASDQSTISSSRQVIVNAISYFSVRATSKAMER